MSSERKRLTNQRNAQKSTGPKTEAGKAKSRRNALKHGLSGAGIVMRRRDEKKLAKRINDWREVLAPINPLEDTLVERAALAAVRCESAVKQEAATRRRRITKALDNLKAKKKREIAAILKLMQLEPGRARRQLKRLKRGVAWLIDAWNALADRLKSRGYLCCADAALLFRLLGKEPDMPYPDDAFVASLRKALVGALPELELEAAEAVLSLNAGEANMDDSAREAAVSAALPEPEEARKLLQSTITHELKRLKQRQAALENDRTEALERAEVIACAQIGTDLDAVRLHRYECAQEMSLHRNLNELIRIRKQEPDLASIARWEKTGKKYNRRWDGYAWVPNSEWRVPEEDGVARDARRGAREEERPKAGETSSHVCRGQSSGEVWPGLSGACPGVLPNNPEPEPSGLVAEGPVTASGGSLCSTPGTRSESHPEEQDADLLADDDVQVSGASLCSAPGTRSDADESADSLQSQATPRVAGFSALREPGAAEPKQEPAEKPMTDGKWLMTEQTPDPAPLSHLPQSLSHQPSVISHASPDPVTHQPSAISHPLPQPPTPNPQPLHQAGCPGSSAASPRLASPALQPADQSRSARTTPLRNEPTASAQEAAIPGGSASTESCPHGLSVRHPAGPPPPEACPQG